MPDHRTPTEEAREEWERLRNYRSYERNRAADALICALEAENKELRERRLPCREAAVAQQRYEQAEARVAGLEERLSWRYRSRGSLDAEARIHALEAAVKTQRDALATSEQARREAEAELAVAMSVYVGCPPTEPTECETKPQGEEDCSRCWRSYITEKAARLPETKEAQP
jgi:chromosome segregation ATPase